MNRRDIIVWIRKAENDFKIGIDEMKHKKPATDMVCFHMQQCIEKYLKAFLLFHNKEIKRTHILESLIKECSELDPDFQKLFEWKVHYLTNYAVEIRYPEDFRIPSKYETFEAIRIAQKVKRFIRKKLREKGFKI
jgi:HEPN domain-containing protein